jgi:hypothetical protein
VGIRLAPEQWKVEVDGIFDATLVAMQTRIYDYARGTYKTYDNMIDDTPPSLQGNNKNIPAAVEISNMFKFRDKTYKNISAVAFWTTISAAMVIFLGSRRLLLPESLRHREEGDTNSDDAHDDSYHDHLWVTIFWKGCILVLLNATGRAIVSLSAKVKLSLQNHRLQSGRRTVNNLGSRTFQENARISDGSHRISEYVTDASVTDSGRLAGVNSATTGGASEDGRTAETAGPHVTSEDLKASSVSGH